MLIDRKKTILIVPVNDEEAFLIAEIAEKLGITVHRSAQAHGAKLENEPKLMESIDGFANVAIVEMPGPEIEQKIRDSSVGKQQAVSLHIIDHHHYTNLDRAHDAKTGQMLPSSLAQFLDLFEVTDEELGSLGYDPRLVRAVGLWDSGYYWALLKAGYSKDEIKKLDEYLAEIDSKIPGFKNYEQYEAAAKAAWENRTEWNGFQVVVSADPKAHTRALVSKYAAYEYWKPVAMIIVERAGSRLYVQESPLAIKLFEHFGGFTFGRDLNWGYDVPEEGKPVDLEDVKKYLAKIS